MEVVKGTFRREVGKIKIRNFEIGGIIANSLMEKGYDLISSPINNDKQEQIGEQITIYKSEQR